MKEVVAQSALLVEHIDKPHNKLPSKHHKIHLCTQPKLANHYACWCPSTQWCWAISMHSTQQNFVAFYTLMPYKEQCENELNIMNALKMTNHHSTISSFSSFNQSVNFLVRNQHRHTVSLYILRMIIPSAQQSCWGVYWFHSVHLSVRPASRVCSVAPTVLVGYISYSYILSSNFWRCVIC